MRARGRAAATVVALVSTALAFTGACRFEPDAWNVLVLVPDTVRGDHLSVNGYPRQTSPFLDALGAEGVNFSNAFTAAPRTWQSFVTILTGLYPPHHDVRYIYDAPLDSSVPSLATLLAARGYETVAFDNINFLRGMTGNAAFNDYILVDRDRIDGNADATLLDQVWEWIQAPRNKPFFVFVRLSGGHWPYNNKRFLREFEPAGDLDHAFNRGGYGVEEGRPGEGFRLKNEDAHRRMVWMPELFENQREHIVAHYDAEIKEVDAIIGKLLERMRQNGVLETTLVVVTSDHGESFGENGYMQHGPRVDDGVMRVPLIFRLPLRHPDSRPGVSVSGLVRTVDIMPTLLHAVGVALPQDLDGVSLVPALRGDGIPDLLAYGESGRSFVGLDTDLYLPGVAGKHRMVRSLDWKLLWVPGAANEFRLFRLPDEHEDVSAQYPDKLAELRAYLESVRAGEIERSKDPSLTPEELRMLRSLGYVP